MSDLLTEQQDNIQIITFNRPQKHNAFDDHLLTALQTVLDDATQNPNIHVIVLKANGKHFSAGADLQWMQRTATLTEEENKADAQILARLLFTWHHSPKPTIAMVQGAAMGGGAGLVAAADIAIAADSARFCFSEVRLGLIPAVISPYVIKAIGERATMALFMSADTLTAEQAKTLQLVQYTVKEDELLNHTLNYAQKIAAWPANTVRAIKTLVRDVAHQPIDDTLQQKTAALIAKQRISEEGQRGMQNFLNKR